MQSASKTGSVSKNKILVVDDHPVIRRGLIQMVNHETDLHICCEAGSVGEALAALGNCHHHLIIVDVLLGDASGLNLVKTIKARQADLPILVMSMHDEDIYAERALRAGAKGYIMKHEAPENVLNAIRQTLLGNIYVSVRMRSIMLQQLIDNPRSPAASPLASLSDQELEVLRQVGLGFSTKEIAATMNRSVKTIEGYRVNLKEKLHLKNGTELIRFATQWIGVANLP